MTRAVSIWILLIFLPGMLYLIGFNGLSLRSFIFIGYYWPLWFLGEPFFSANVDWGWQIPTWLGAFTTAFIYSAIYWGGLYLYKN